METSRQGTEQYKGEVSRPSNSRLSRERPEETREYKRHRAEGINPKEYDQAQEEGVAERSRGDFSGSSSRDPRTHGNPSGGLEATREKEEARRGRVGPGAVRNGDIWSGLGSGGPAQLKGFSAQDPAGSCEAKNLENNPRQQVKGGMMRPIEIGESLVKDDTDSKALGSLVKIDKPISLTNFQEAITNAMKEAMASQFCDWFGAGKGKVEGSLKQKHDIEEEGKAKDKESGSQASFVPDSNREVIENIDAEDKHNPKSDIGSYTKGLLIEACEQLSKEKKLSRERLQEEDKEEKGQEQEVVSPDSRKRRSTPKDKEATRTSIRQYQKRGGKACSRGETLALAEQRKQLHQSPGMHFTLLDFLSDDTLIYIAKSCGVSIEGIKGHKGVYSQGGDMVDRSFLRPVVGVQ